MGVYNDEVKKEIEEKWQKEKEKKIASLSKTAKGYFTAIGYSGYYFGYGDDLIKDIYEKLELFFTASMHEGKKPSQFFYQKEFKEIIDAFLTDELKEYFLYIADKYIDFQLHAGYYRRSLRSKDYSNHFKNIMNSLEDFINFGVFTSQKVSFKNYITNNMSEELIGYKLAGNKNYSVCNMLAAALDKTDKDVEKAVEDMILSENNINIITYDIIRGIVRSSNEKLHKMLSDLLLAARLQEGLRQAICENMDAGVKEAFFILLRKIIDNNLIRFSSVKRAISTFIGICDEQNIDRINNKMLVLMDECLHSEKKRKEYFNSSDAIEINVALWAEGFYDAESAGKEVLVIFKSGKKERMLAAAFFAKMLQIENITNEIAKSAINEHNDIPELIAICMSFFFIRISTIININILKDYHLYGEPLPDAKSIDAQDYFGSVQEAEKLYDNLMKIYSSLKTDKTVFSPCVFPWNTVTLLRSNVVECLCVLAYSLKDQKKTEEVFPLLKHIEVYRRSMNIAYLLNKPKTKAEREAVINLLSDKAEQPRKEANKIVSSMDLTEDEYTAIAEMLKYKSSDTRINVINILYKQGDELLLKTLANLIASKNEDTRLGAMDIILKLSKDKERANCYEKAKILVCDIKNASVKEQIIIDEIMGIGQTAAGVLSMEGYGLYNPNAEIEIPFKEAPKTSVLLKNILGSKDKKENHFKKIFTLSQKECINIIYKLDKLIDENSTKEYKTRFGNMSILGERYLSESVSSGSDGYDEMKAIDKYPFKELWTEFYEKEIKNTNALIQICTMFNMPEEEEIFDYVGKYIKDIFGGCVIPYFETYLKYPNVTERVLNTILFRTYRDEKTLFNAACFVMEYMYENIAEDKVYFEIDDDGDTKIENIFGTEPFTNYENFLDLYKNNEEFKRAFIIKYALNKKQYFAKKEYNKTSEEKIKDYGGIYGEKYNYMDIIDIVKASVMGICEKDIVYKAVFGIFEDIGIYNIRSIHDISVFIRDNLAPYEEKKLEQTKKALGSDMFEKVKELSKEVYSNITNMVLSVELKRGDSATKFSSIADNIKYIEGAGRFIEILKALGKETLDRTSYYYGSSGKSKKSVMSSLLKAVYPKETDNAKTLSKMLEGSGIKTERLVEAAMYSPQWMDIAGEYLGWEGFKMGCYYFIAHMNESFDERKMAVIAKYTPLTSEELQEGAFDIEWFKEAYQKLGEEKFNVLYDSAKYISDGAKHSRARKYADAVLGKLNIKESEKEISAKRNKDLLMAYSLIPIDKKDEEKDLVSRYQFIQKFLKESKQFGAQRKASEGKASEIALKNLATNKGFTDITRFTLYMESKVMEGFKEYFDFKKEGEYLLKIEIDKTGKSAIVVKKDDKVLSSVPAALKKSEYLATLKEVNKNLKDQFSRSKKMFENAMENASFFELSELTNLFDNPVVYPIIEKLLFITDKNEIGFVTKTALINYKNEKIKITPKTNLRAAHALDLYKDGNWSEWQKVLFDKEIEQPFKQIFREIYVKTKEELDLEHSTRYAGNQIQVKKTIALLKTRGWLIDSEEGLQKVYYKENIIARIYALADWFSPSDIEAPTLEWVEFSDRKTFKSIKIKDVPEMLFSEIMRDVDLVVSAAHAGGVDPETSHSTIEMRAAIVKFNMPLFKLTNVKVQDNHAIIDGSLAKYSVHLGSGIIHQIAGSQINVLPVHSQARGKLFLPFVDEDPKTAEIVSKIVLFAEDNKIKDPFILTQIKQGKK